MIVTGERSPEIAVRRYYDMVDRNDVDGLVGLFSNDVVYRRPGYRPIEGRPALEAFYRGERVIESGRHTISEIVVQGNRAAVSGEFAGVLKDGSQVSVRFADFFVSSERGLFRRRDTYFFAPAV